LRTGLHLIFHLNFLLNNYLISDSANFRRISGIFISRGRFLQAVTKNPIFARIFKD
jgi:hypothetical protein